MYNFKEYTDEERQYYVYEHLLDGIPFYVGYEHGERAYIRDSSRSRFWKEFVKDRKKEVEVRIIVDKLTKTEAIQLEKEYQIKRREEGFNIVGVIGSTGGQFCKGKIPWNKGLKGEGTSMYGKKHSEETKEKIRQAHLGKPRYERTI